MIVYSLSWKRSKNIEPHLAWVIFHKVYNMNHGINSMEKVRSTNKSTFTLPQYLPTIHSTLYGLENFLLTSMVSKYDHIRLGIMTRLNFIPMGTRKTLLSPTSGSTSQKYGSAKLVSAHPYDTHSSYYHIQVASD